MNLTEEKRVLTGFSVCVSEWIRRHADAIVHPASTSEVASLLELASEDELMKMIKDGFDPGGILNPGKIF